MKKNTHPPETYETNEKQCGSWTAKGSYRGFLLCQINDKAHSVFIHRNNILPKAQLPDAAACSKHVPKAAHTSATKTKSYR